MEIGVRNDEQLIKMATIVQRALNNSGGEDSLGITEEEKQELLEELDKLNSNFEKRKMANQYGFTSVNQQVTSGGNTQQELLSK